MSKVISRIVIEPSAEIKALLDDFKQTASDVIAACAKTHSPHQPTGALLDTMQHAANDSLSDAIQAFPYQQGIEEWRARNAKPRNLGQWIFEGQDKEWVSASFDEDGLVFLWNVPRNELDMFNGTWIGGAGSRCKEIPHTILDGDWQYSPINREPVNDVDYLSDDKQQIDEIALDDQRTRLLAESVPYITPKDYQSLFISGLADLLIQRMHSQDRFSDDDYDILGADLMPWDVVKTDYESDEFGIVVALAVNKFKGEDKSRASIVGIRKFHNGYQNTGHTLSYSLMPTADRIRTITQDEIASFRKALEACYA